MLNQGTFIGRLTRKPELRRLSPDNCFTTFCLAVDRDMPDQTGNWPSDFIHCVVWDTKKAEKICSKYDKSDLICVSGRMQNRDTKTKDGQIRQGLELVVQVCYKVKAPSNASSEAPQPDASPEAVCDVTEDDSM